MQGGNPIMKRQCQLFNWCLDLKVFTHVYIKGRFSDWYLGLERSPYGLPWLVSHYHVPQTLCIYICTLFIQLDIKNSLIIHLISTSFLLNLSNMSLCIYFVSTAFTKLFNFSPINVFSKIIFLNVLSLWICL